LARNLGNTVGVPLISTYVTHQELAHLTKMMRIQTLERERPNEVMGLLQGAFAQAGQPLDEATARSQGVVRNQLIERATIEAYHDSFRLVAFAGLLLVPLVLFIRGDERGRQRKPMRFGPRRHLATEPKEAPAADIAGKHGS
jgi:hypothetical protein